MVNFSTMVEFGVEVTSTSFDSSLAMKTCRGKGRKGAAPKF